jgi:predicted DNA-binding transcriptional regulator
MNFSSEKQPAPELEEYRKYLTLFSELQLSLRLHDKEEAYDIVQQTTREAVAGLLRRGLKKLSEHLQEDV